METTESLLLATFEFQTSSVVYLETIAASAYESECILRSHYRHDIFMSGVLVAAFILTWLTMVLLER